MFSLYEKSQRSNTQRRPKPGGYTEALSRAGPDRPGQGEEEAHRRGDTGHPIAAAGSPQPHPRLRSRSWCTPAGPLRSGSTWFCLCPVLSLPVKSPPFKGHVLFTADTSVLVATSQRADLRLLAGGSPPPCPQRHRFHGADLPPQQDTRATRHLPDPRWPPQPQHSAHGNGMGGFL